MLAKHDSIRAVLAVIQFFEKRSHDGILLKCWNAMFSTSLCHFYFLIAFKQEISSFDTSGSCLFWNPSFSCSHLVVHFTYSFLLSVRTCSLATARISSKRRLWCLGWAGVHWILLSTCLVNSSHMVFWKFHLGFGLGFRTEIWKPMLSKTDLILGNMFESVFVQCSGSTLEFFEAKHTSRF